LIKVDKFITAGAKNLSHFYLNTKRNTLRSCPFGIAAVFNFI